MWPPPVRFGAFASVALSSEWHSDLTGWFAVQGVAEWISADQQFEESSLQTSAARIRSFAISLVAPRSLARLNASPLL